jgi:hypothetical protein
MDNFKRSKGLLGSKHLSIIQNHYTEQRLYRIMGKDGKFSQLMLNQQSQNQITGVIEIVNDVTVGKYAIKVDDAPLSDTFLDAQFQEMLMLLQKMGPAIAPFMPMFADLMIDMSSMPRKDEWIERIKAVADHANQQQQQGQPPPGHHPPAPHGGKPAPHPGQAQPGPLGGGAVSQNVIPFSHAHQNGG